MGKFTNRLSSMRHEIVNNFNPKFEKRDPLKDRFDNNPNFMLQDASHLNGQFSIMDLPNVPYNSIGRATRAEKFMHALNTKRGVCNYLDTVRDIYYVDSLIRDVGSEVLNRGYDKKINGDFIKFSFSKNFDDKDGIEKKIKKDIKDLRIHELLRDYMDDFLFYGELVFDYNPNTMDIDDSLVQKDYLSAYHKSELSRVFDSENMRLTHKSHFFVLSLFSYRNRIRIESEESKEVYVVKIPRGIIPYSLVKRFKDLDLLETLQPILELQAIDEKMYFYITFPAGKDASEAYKECRNYEKLIKSVLYVDQTGNTDTVTGLIDRITSVKVIPKFGNQDTLQSQTINKSNKIELSQLDDIRSSISTALKIDITGKNKNQDGEYLKLINTIRVHIASSIKVFLKSHIHNRYGVDVTDDDFDVDLPLVQGANELDTAEFSQIQRNSLKDDFSLLEESFAYLTKLINNPFIDKENLLSLFKERLGNLSMSSVVNMDDIERKARELIDKGSEEDL